MADVPFSLVNSWSTDPLECGILFVFSRKNLGPIFVQKCIPWIWISAARPSKGSEDGLTLILLTWTIWRAPTNASKWRIGFNSAFKGLIGSRTETKGHADTLPSNSQQSDLINTFVSLLRRKTGYLYKQADQQKSKQNELLTCQRKRDIA